MIELEVAEIRVSGADTPPVVVLAELGGAQRLLPIWMSHSGAAAILGATEEADAQRPSIHDLVGGIITELGQGELQSVRITGCDEGQFFAELVFADRALPARPSDALALALRVGCGITCPAELMDEYGIEADAEVEPASGEAEEVVERFLEFLNSVTAEDFSGDEEEP